MPVLVDFSILRSDKLYMKKVSLLLFFTMFLMMSCKTESDSKETSNTIPSIKKDSIKSALKLIENQKNEQENPNTFNCLEAVLAMIESSDHYKELTDGLADEVMKNNGTGIGFMVHVSPNPEKDQALEKGDFYEISLHESYPNRMVNRAFYRYDRHQNHLYVLDIVSAEYEEITFNNQLKNQFKQNCDQ